jgi:phosphoribosylanthranilate isomerase
MFFEESKRNITFERAAGIIRELPPFVSKTGVFVNAPVEFIHRAIEIAGIDTIQLHGEEPPEFCAQFAPLKVIKAFRVRGAGSLQDCVRYRGQAWLLDSYVSGTQGGTGTAFDWDVAVDAVKLSRLVIVAGGLKPETVADAIRKVHPFAVDVSSGVESAPGKKDHGRIRDFIQSAREAA